MDALLLLNCQNDFVKEGYSKFYDVRSPEVSRSIIRLIKANEYDDLIPILDLHSSKDTNKSGHCYGGSEGFKMFTPLRSIIENRPFKTTAFLKNDKRPLITNVKFLSFIKTLSKNDTLHLAGFEHHRNEITDIEKCINTLGLKINQIESSLLRLP